MRLIDLHCDWARQYAAEVCRPGATDLAAVRSRLGQVEGYLSGTALAVLCCGQDARAGADPQASWLALGEQITRYEAEFPGRLLLGSQDVERWKAEPAEGLCWGMLKIGGLDDLVRTTGDLDRLPGLFHRGVRFFQVVANSPGALTAPADGTGGLTALGRGLLEGLEALARAAGPAGPRPVVDVAAMSARATSDVLSWFESDPERADRLLLVRSHGTIATAARSAETGLSDVNLKRLRALGGVVGLTPGLPHFTITGEFSAAIETAAAVPFRGTAGYAGIALGTDFLGLEQTLPEAENVLRLSAWIAAGFDSDAAQLLQRGNAWGLLLKSAGAA